MQVWYADEVDVKNWISHDRAKRNEIQGVRWIRVKCELDYTIPCWYNQQLSSLCSFLQQIKE